MTHVFPLRRTAAKLVRLGIAAATFGAVLLALSASANAEWKRADMNDTINQTNFLVNRGCSGTLIDKDKGLILSAYHCIDEQYEIVEREQVADDGTIHRDKVRVSRPGTATQKFFGGSVVVRTSEYVYKVQAGSSALDLALLKLQSPTESTRNVKMGCGDPERGEVVYAVGNSFVILYSTLTKGIVSSLQRSYRDLLLAGELGDSTDDGEHGLVQFSAPIAPGNSGGALFNDAGEFIGVNVRAVPGGFSFAVPQSDIRKFLTDAGAGDLFAHCPVVQ